MERILFHFLRKKKKRFSWLAGEQTRDGREALNCNESRRKGGWGCRRTGCAVSTAGTWPWASCCTWDSRDPSLLSRWLEGHWPGMHGHAGGCGNASSPRHCNGTLAFFSRSPPLLIAPDLGPWCPARSAQRRALPVLSRTSSCLPSMH